MNECQYKNKTLISTISAGKNDSASVKVVESETLEHECQNSIWEGSDEYCILHEPNSEKPQKSFKEQLIQNLQAEKSGSLLTFAGYTFPVTAPKDENRQRHWRFGDLLEQAGIKKPVEQTVLLADSTFHRPFRIDGLVFKNSVYIQNVKFVGGFCSLSEVEFKSGLIFKAELDGGWLTMENVTIRGMGSVSPTFKNHSASRMNNIYVTTPEWQESIYKRGRERAEELDDRELADKHFRGEMISKRRQLFPAFDWYKWEFSLLDVDKWVEFKNRISFQDWEGWLKLLFIRPFWWLADLTTGYGTKWGRVLLSWIVVILGFWGGYSLFNSLILTNSSSSSVTLLSKLYFSIVTFTTLGYGDIVPNGPIWQFVAGFESIIGGFLMASFVIVFGRKFMR